MRLDLVNPRHVHKVKTAENIPGHLNAVVNAVVAVEMTGKRDGMRPAPVGQLFHIYVAEALRKHQVVAVLKIRAFLTLAVGGYPLSYVAAESCAVFLLYPVVIRQADEVGVEYFAGNSVVKARLVGKEPGYRLSEIVPEPPEIFLVGHFYKAVHRAGAEQIDRERLERAVHLLRVHFFNAESVIFVNKPFCHKIRVCVRHAVHAGAWTAS